MHLKLSPACVAMLYYTIITGLVLNGQQEATLTVDTTNLLNDTTYTCQVVSTRYPGSEHGRAEAQLNIYSK